MVSSRQIELPIYRSVGRQRGWGFGALAQDIGRTAIRYLRRYIVRAANTWVLSCCKSVCHKLHKHKLLVVEKNGRQLQRVWEDKFWENNWVMVAGKKGQQSHSNKFCKTNQSIENRPFHKLFSIFMLSNFRYQSFVAVSRSLGGKVLVVDNVLSSHGTRNLSYYLTWLKLYKVWISSGSELERWFETDTLGLKMKFVKDSGYET